MNTPDTQHIEPHTSEEKHAETAPLYFLPSWFFFSESISIELGASPEAVRERVSLQIESSSPIPPEQLLSGFRFDQRETSILCYAGARERLKERVTHIPAGTLHVLPTFAIWENNGTGTSHREWFATDEEITAVTFDKSERFPKEVFSWQIERGDKTDAEFNSMLIATREEKQKELPQNSEDKPGIYLLGTQSINKKARTGNIGTMRLNADGSVVPAAKVIEFSLSDNSLWFADIRDSETLIKERKDRKNLAIAGTILKVLIAIAALLFVIQIALWIFGYTIKGKQATADAQRPTVEKIQSQDKLIDDISKIQENRLQLMRIVSVLNALRPDGVGFTNFTGNGTDGAISVTGNAETIALANEFEKNIHACGIFRNISFSANMSSNGTNFSMQCTPIKSKLAEIDFYADSQKQTEDPVESKGAEDEPIQTAEEKTSDSEVTDSEGEDGGQK